MKGFPLWPLIAPAVLLSLAAGPLRAAPSKMRYDIPAQRLDRALLMLGARSGRQIVFNPDSVRGRRSRPLRGSYDLTEALARILPDKGLWAQVDGAVVLIVPAPPPHPPPPAQSVQDEPPLTTVNIEPTVVQEVAVTALKYETLLQKTPISISSVERGLAERGEISINDFYRRIPALHVTTNNANQQRLSIRGVRSTGESTTGLYYDETPVTGPAGSAADAGSTQPDLNLFDVQRIEVLRGPQGTLYGAGSMGGTVRVIFNKPDLDQASARIEARAALTHGGAPTTSLRAVGNLPLVEGKLALRLAAYSEDAGGYIDNVRFGRTNVNGETARGFRAAVALAPTDAVSVLLTAAHQRESLADATGYWYPRLGRNRSDSNIVADYESAVDLFNITTKWEAPFASILATASHYSWKTLYVSDYTAVLQRAAADPTTCSAYFALASACDEIQAATFATYAAQRIPGAWYQPATLEAGSQELRMSSHDHDSIDWTVGVFREDRRDHFDSIVYAADPLSGRVLTGGVVTGYRTIVTRVRQLAAFGEASYHPTDRLTFTAGARRYRYDKTVGGEVVVPNHITGSSPTPFSEVAARDQGWVTKLSVMFEPTAQSMVYLTRAEGFRPGGANNVPGAGAEAPDTYAPDRLTSYELGAKVGLFEGRMTVDGAVYNLDWTDMQVSASSPNGAWRFNTNAGRARIIGGELEVVARPVSGLWVMVNAAYVDAKLAKDQRNGIGVATGNAGDRLPYTPRWSGAISIVRRSRLFDRYQTAARFDYSYTGGSASDFRPSLVTYQKQPPYGLVDVQYSAERGGTELSLRVANLFDVRAPQLVTASVSGVRNQTYSVRPRTITLGLRHSF